MNDVEVAVSSEPARSSARQIGCNRVGAGNLGIMRGYRCVRPAESGRVGIEGQRCLDFRLHRKSAAEASAAPCAAGRGAKAGAPKRSRLKVIQRYGQGIRIGMMGPERGRQPAGIASACSAASAMGCFFRPRCAPPLRRRRPRARRPESSPCSRARNSWRPLGSNRPPVRLSVSASTSACACALGHRSISRSAHQE